MKNHFPESVKGRSLAVVAAALVAALSAAASNAQVAEARVVAKANQYSFRASAYGSLSTLEEAIRQARPAAVHLDACGPGASRALGAAVDRLSDLVLYLRILDESSPPCRGGAVAMTASHRTTPALPDIDDAAVERYWQQVAP